MSAEWTRRRFIETAGAGAAALGLPSVASGFGSPSMLDVAELVIPGVSVHRPGAWKRLLFEIIQTTSVEASPVTVQVDPEDPVLFEHPFCVLVAEAPIAGLSDAGVRQIERFLSYGGFLLIDDASGEGDGAIAKSVRRLAGRIFPTRPVSPLPADHAVFRSFFLLDSPVGRTLGTGVLEGVSTGPTTPLVFCGSDLSGALDRSPSGQDRYPVVPGGERQRREALKLGVNLMLYALTSNYKHDIAHTLELMREGRLE
jgi:hypothetical protein